MEAIISTVRRLRRSDPDPVVTIEKLLEYFDQTSFNDPGQGSWPRVAIFCMIVREGHHWESPASSNERGVVNIPVEAEATLTTQLQRVTLRREPS